jgi:hypothetical protein
MDCCCDQDAPKVFERDEIVARKTHRCCECGGTILPGNVYERVSGLWEDKWYHFSTCERCADLRRSVSESICAPLKELDESYYYLTGKRLKDLDIPSPP